MPVRPRPWRRSTGLRRTPDARRRDQRPAARRHGRPGGGDPPRRRAARRRCRPGGRDAVGLGDGPGGLAPRGPGHPRGLRGRGAGSRRRSAGGRSSSTTCPGISPRPRPGGPAWRRPSTSLCPTGPSTCSPVCRTVSGSTPAVSPPPTCAPTTTSSATPATRPSRLRVRGVATDRVGRRLPHGCRGRRAGARGRSTPLQRRWPSTAGGSRSGRSGRRCSAPASTTTSTSHRGLGLAGGQLVPRPARRRRAPAGQPGQADAAHARPRAALPAHRGRRTRPARARRGRAAPGPCRRDDVCRHRRATRTRLHRGRSDERRGRRGGRPPPMPPPCVGSGP